MSPTGSPLHDSDAWRRINELFHRALDQHASDRDAFIRSEAADPTIVDEVLALVDAHERASGFLEMPAAPLPTSANPLAAPATIGPYRILRVLGEGGMGLVYFAEDTRLGRTVALKAVRPALVGEPGRHDRLRREARAAAALNHPGIATVYALEDIDGGVYIAGEYVAGETLRDELERGPLDAETVLETAIALARALAAAHTRGVVHRDLKPENVIRAADGGVKILDFGLAKTTGPSHAGATLSADGLAFGTPAYMSPEQIRGEEVDGRSDLFSLGVVLCECLTGRNPFQARDAAATIARILTETPPPMTETPAGATSRIAGDLEPLVRRCLEKTAAARFPSADVLVGALLDVQRARLIGSAVALPPSGPVARDGAPSRAVRWWTFHQAAATTAYALLVVVLWRVRHEPALGAGGVWLFLAALVSAIVASAVRLHLWFTLIVDRETWTDGHGGARLWRQVCDGIFVAALTATGVAILDADEHVGILLVAAAAAVLVSFALVEPATTRAAGRASRTHQPAS